MPASIPINTHHAVTPAHTAQDLAQALLSRQERIPLPYGWPAADPFPVFDLLLCDHPGLLHVLSLGTIQAGDAGYNELVPTYANPDEALERTRLMEDAIAPLVAAANDLPYRARIQAVRDWLLDNASLSDRSIEGTDFAWGPILYGLGRQAAFVRAFIFISRHLALRCAPGLVERGNLVHEGFAHFWVDVYAEERASNREEFPIGCVDIVGDAYDKRAGHPVGPALVPFSQVTQKYGEPGEAYWAYREICNPLPQPSKGGNHG